MKVKKLIRVTTLLCISALLFSCKNVNDLPEDDKKTETPSGNESTEKDATENVPTPGKDDWDVAVPLSLGEKDGIAYVNTTTGKFGFYIPTSARYVASGDSACSGDFVYVSDSSNADNSSAFFTVTKEGDTELAKPEVYNTPVDTAKTTEKTAYNVAMESTKETIEYVKTAGKATYYDITVTEVAEKPGLTISVSNTPNITAIQYFIRNKATGKVYTTYFGNGNTPTSYYFPFVNADGEYQCYVAMTDAVNCTIMYNSKVAAYTTATGKGELTINNKMNPSDIEVSAGVLTVSNLKFPEVQGATNSRLVLTLCRGTDWNDANYKWVDQRVIYNDNQTTYTCDYGKRLSNTNLKEVANQNCFITMTYNFTLDGSDYQFTSITEDKQFKFVYDDSKLLPEYDAIPDENGVKFIFNKKGNADVTYFYVQKNGEALQIQLDDVNNVTKNAQGGIEVVYPFCQANVEQTFIIYAQWSDDSSLYKWVTKTPGGGWKTLDQVLDIGAWNNTTITLSAGTEDGDARLLKAKDSTFAAIAKDSAVANPCIEVSVWGRKDGETWFEKAGEYKVKTDADFAALYGSGLSIFTDGFCSKIGMNAAASYKGTKNNNKYSYKYTARYTFEINDSNFASTYGDYAGMSFTTPEKNKEFEYEPVTLAPITTGVKWTGPAQGNWETPSVFISKDCFVDGDTALSTSQTLRIYITSTYKEHDWWEKVYVRSRSKTAYWNSEYSAKDEEGVKENYLDLSQDLFVNVEGDNYYIDIPLTGEDDVVKDIIASDLELWSCNGTATTFTKVEIL